MNNIKIRRFLTAGAFIALGLALSGCSLYKTSQNGSTAQDQSSQSANTEEAKAAVTINYTDSGFEPASSTVKAGGTITWVNKSSNAISVASDPHPVHTDNPELTNGKSTLQLAAGASATVTVNKAGTWGFHNHLEPGMRGKVAVK